MSDSTPGPWEASGNGVHKMHSKKYGSCICICDGSDRHANAHLIAAAPELLEALEDLVDKANDAGWHKELLVSANDAIKKARGEQ